MKTPRRQIPNNGSDRVLTTVTNRQWRVISAICATTITTFEHATTKTTDF